MKTPTKISPHFYHHEFFSKGMWQTHSKEFLKKLLDPKIVPIMEKIRTSLGKAVYINNWYWPTGNSQYRGFRPFSTSVGARYSQHKFGRAIDFHVKDMTPDEVRTYILDNQSEYLRMGVTRLEDGRDARTWVHLDLAWTGEDHIHVFRA